MVRRFAVLSFVALAGCAGLKDALTAHQDVVARAAGQELSVSRLAELLAPVKNVPLRREIVDRVADLWVDYQLLGQAAAQGDSLLDTATVWAANWPDVAQRIADHLHDTMIVARARVTDAQVDSAYTAGNVRWLDHILVAVRQDTSDEVKAARRRIAEGYLAQLRHGADFARLAAQKSGDPGSAKSGGSLGLVPRGAMVKPFEDAAFGLKPGEVSDLVITPYGYHIIWRPRLDQVRDSFALRLKDLVVQRLDSLYVDSLNRETGIRVKSSAPAAVRAAVSNPRSAKRSGRVLATYRGGELTEKNFVRWLQAFPPQTRMSVANAPDSTLAEFVKSIARNDMLMHTAQQRHIGLSAADRDSISGQFRVELRGMEDRLGVTPESLAADTSARQARPQAAGRRVDGYFDDIIRGASKRGFFEVPPFLSDVLRERYAWNISPAGVDRALERAKDLRGPTAPPGAQGVSPMTPAPSGPPLGSRPQGPAPRGRAAPRPPQRKE
jgi:hypothetical protein